jgi:hypothetical protein
MFGERADRKFAMPRVTDFSDNQHVKGPLQDAGDFRRDDDATARQSQNDIRLEASFEEVVTEFTASFLAGRKGHIQNVASFPPKINALWTPRARSRK